jgi:hypothetical protein
MAIEIFERIYVGGMVDTRTWNSRIICVMNRRPIDLHPTAHHVCVVDEQQKFSGAKLTAAAAFISALHDGAGAHQLLAPPKQDNLLVADEFGQLQAPMVVSWYLHTVKRLPFPEIYAMFKEKGHPFGN